MEVRMCYLRDGALHDQPFAKLPVVLAPYARKAIGCTRQTAIYSADTRFRELVPASSLTRAKGAEVTLMQVQGPTRYVSW